MIFQSAVMVTTNRMFRPMFSAFVKLQAFLFRCPCCLFATSWKERVLFIRGNNYRLFVQREVSGYATRNNFSWLRGVFSGRLVRTCVCVCNVELHIKAVMLLIHHIVPCIKKGYLDVPVFIIDFCFIGNCSVKARRHPSCLSLCPLGTSRRIVCVGVDVCSSLTSPALSALAGVKVCSKRRGSWTFQEIKGVRCKRTRSMPSPCQDIDHLLIRRQQQGWWCNSSLVTEASAVTPNFGQLERLRKLY